LVELTSALMLDASALLGCGEGNVKPAGVEEDINPSF
jgi:hypothetical protein